MKKNIFLALIISILSFFASGAMAQVKTVNTLIAQSEFNGDASKDSPLPSTVDGEMIITCHLEDRTIKNGIYIYTVFIQKVDNNNNVTDVAKFSYNNKEGWKVYDLKTDVGEPFSKDRITERAIHVNDVQSGDQIRITIKVDKKLLLSAKHSNLHPNSLMHRSWSDLMLATSPLIHFLLPPAAIQPQLQASISCPHPAC